jgi:hypothetical protein
MGATRTLFGKELRQHGAALGGMTALLALAWGLLALAQSLEARVLSALEMVPGFAMIPLVAAALYLGQRLVVAEYFGRTQRFIEALPVWREQMALVKAVFGLACLALWGAGALLASARLGARSEPIGGHFLGILAARLGLYVFALWGVVFLLGLLGRLRLPVAGALVAFVVLLDRYTIWELGRFGPFALIARDSFAFERQRLPVTALWQSAVVAIVAFALAWALVRVREGSIVESLARRMSPRELSTLMVLASGAGMAFIALHKEPDPEPFAFTTTKVVRAPRGSVEIAYLEDPLRPAAEQLAAAIEPTLEAFATALALPWPLPPVRLVHGPEIDPRDPRVVRSHPDQGLVLRVNLGEDSARARTRIIATILHQLIWARTRGRAAIEPKHWLLDGFALHFALHGRQAAAGPFDGTDPTLLRAVAATEVVPLRAQTLRDYAMTAEQLGDELTEALAASGWHLLEARAGRDKALALARAAFDRPGTGDVRDLVHEWRDPLPLMFQRTTGIAWNDFLSTWIGALDRLRANPPAPMPSRDLPRRIATAVRASADTGVGAEVQLDAPLPAGTACSLKHRRLPPYDTPFSSEDLEEVGFLWPPGETHVLRLIEGTYGRGERAFVALDCELVALGASARFVAGRVTVP